MIDKELLAILACPETKEPVALAEERTHRRTQQPHCAWGGQKSGR